VAGATRASGRARLGLPRHPALTADTTADLVVVGGGCTGLWTGPRAKDHREGRRNLLLRTLDAVGMGFDS
jgi:hypothetical protein